MDACDFYDDDYNGLVNLPEQFSHRSEVILIFCSSRETFWTSVTSKRSSYSCLQGRTGLHSSRICIHICHCCCLREGIKLLKMCRMILASFAREFDSCIVALTRRSDVGASSRKDFMWLAALMTSEASCNGTPFMSCGKAFICQTLLLILSSLSSSSPFPSSPSLLPLPPPTNTHYLTSYFLFF